MFSEHLEALLGDDRANTFLTDVWNKKPIYYKNWNSHYFDDLLKVSELDSLFISAQAKSSEFAFIPPPDTYFESDSLNGPGGRLQLNQLLGYYEDGGTIRIKNLQKYKAEMTRLCQDWRLALGVDVEMDLWLTKPTEEETPPYLHYDGYNIFVLQVHGKKRWRVYDPDNCAYMEPRVGSVLSADEVGNPLFDVVLEPGDILYMPAGTPHAVTPESRDVLHLGIGVHTTTWNDVLAKTIERMKMLPNILSTPADKTLLPLEADDDALKKSLIQIFSQALESLDMQWVKGSLKQDFINHLALTEQNNSIQEILNESPIELETLLERRADMECTVYKKDGNASIEWPLGGEITGPIALFDTFMFIATQETPFTATMLPDDLENDAKLMIVETLIHRGLIHRSYTV